MRSDREARRSTSLDLLRQLIETDVEGLREIKDVEEVRTGTRAAQESDGSPVTQSCLCRSVLYRETLEFSLLAKRHSKSVSPLALLSRNALASYYYNYTFIFSNPTTC